MDAASGGCKMSLLDASTSSAPSPERLLASIATSGASFPPPASAAGPQADLTIAASGGIETGSGGVRFGLQTQASPLSHHPDAATNFMLLANQQQQPQQEQRHQVLVPSLVQPGNNTQQQGGSSGDSLMEMKPPAREASSSSSSTSAASALLLIKSEGGGGGETGDVLELGLDDAAAAATNGGGTGLNDNSVVQHLAIAQISTPAGEFTYIRVRPVVICMYGRRRNT